MWIPRCNIFFKSYLILFVCFKSLKFEKCMILLPLRRMGLRKGREGREWTESTPFIGYWAAENWDDNLTHHSPKVSFFYHNFGPSKFHYYLVKMSNKWVLGKKKKMKNFPWDVSNKPYGNRFIDVFLIVLNAKKIGAQAKVPLIAITIYRAMLKKFVGILFFGACLDQS